MRKFHAELKPYLRDILNRTRYKLGFTQEKMATTVLYMAPRSYSNLEHGKSGFSAVSLMLLFIFLPDDAVINVVRGFEDIILSLEQKEAG